MAVRKVLWIAAFSPIQCTAALRFYLQLRINLNEGRVAQIMGRGPYRVWFKGIDYPGGSCW